MRGPTMRYLSIDLGERRTGIAAGDDVTGIISPLRVIDTAPALLLDELLKIIAAHKPDAIVLGVPLNMDGTEAGAAQKTRAFGETLSQRCRLPMHYQDERLSSYAADQAMARTGRTRKAKRALRDALAAAEILRDFFDGL